MRATAARDTREKEREKIKRPPGFHFRRRPKHDRAGQVVFIKTEILSFFRPWKTEDRGRGYKKPPPFPGLRPLTNISVCDHAGLESMNTKGPPEERRPFKMALLGVFNALPINLSWGRRERLIGTV